VDTLKNDFVNRPLMVVNGLISDIGKVVTTGVVFAGLLYVKGMVAGGGDKGVMENLKKGAGLSVGLYIGTRLLA